MIQDNPQHSVSDDSIRTRHALHPDREEFLRNAASGAIQPVVLELPLGDILPHQLYAAARSVSAEGSFMLETGRGAGLSYVGYGALGTWESRGTTCTSTAGGGGTTTGDPFEALRRELTGREVIPNPLLENFVGGAVGFFSYDMARRIERLPELAVDDLGLPESRFLLVDGFYEIDHRADVLRLVYAPMPGEEDPEQLYDMILERLGSMADLVGSLAPEESLHIDEGDPGRAHAGSGHEANMTSAEFEAIVAKAKEYIVAGDIFQVNLSVRFAQECRVDPLLLYRVLRDINPSPYMCLLESPDLAVVSASPELLVRVRGTTIETRPIAGTRPRGRDDEEDRRRAEELIENEKERAEHLMLVDLERNDIGRVAAYGTVVVDELMAIERYSHVIHIVSNVRGELAEGRDVFDAIRACFPGGTITGAPKVRSMEIIEELEPCRRGIYTGSIGWIGRNGDTDLNIVIRTILLKGGRAFVQAGAGIVVDSVPAYEYKESLRKAAASMLAVERANLAAARMNGGAGTEEGRRGI